MTPFDGSTYDPDEDFARLKTALARVVWLTKRDPEWRTLHTLSAWAKCSQAGVSARLRDLRKPKSQDKYGPCEVESRRQAGGLWLYRVRWLPRQGSLINE